jgi:glycolate oxidase
MAARGEAIEAILKPGFGGTLSGEHAPGLQSPVLEKETSAATIFYSSASKALDPNNILNPGKIIGG